MQFFQTQTIKNILRLASGIWVSEDGAASVIFGLALVIIIGSMALMVDVTRVFVAKSHLANFSESAALAVARNLNFLTEEELEDLATTMTASTVPNSSIFMFNSQSVTTTTVLSTELSSGLVSVTIEATVPTTLLQVFDFADEMTIAETVTAFQYAPEAEIVFVLESSSEMEQSGKLVIASTAVNEFISVFDNHRVSDTGIVFGFIPFGSELVNVAPHTDWLEEGLWPTDVPPNVSGTSDWVGELAEDRWCVLTRSGDAGTLDVTPAHTRFPLVLEILKTEIEGDVAHYSNITSTDCRSEPIISLTENTEIILQLTSSLAGNGEAYSGRAMIWAERMLSPDWQPYWQTTEGPPTEYDDEDIQKVVILVTGSANTAPDTENSLFSEACDRMKSNDVTVYVVDFLAPDSIAEILTNCATSKGHYFRAENEASVSEALYAIAKFLTVVKFSG